jgi:PPP family 3-phenylpropionic acid transporter
VLAGRASRPIAWLRIGCALTLASFLLFLLPLGFAGMFVSMCVFCFAWNAVMPQFESITLSHLAGQSERYGGIRVWGSVGFIAVVALFGVLFDFIAITALPWLMLPLFVVLLGASFANEYALAPADADRSSNGFAKYLKQPEAIAFLGVAFLMQVSFGPYYTFFSLYLDQHGYRASSLGAYWAIAVTVEIVVFFLAARILARWDATRVLILALASAALRWWATALWPENAILMGCAQLTHALNFAAFFVACMQLLARLFPGRINGHGQGAFYGLSSGVGGVAGALLAGWIWERHGSHASFAAAGFIALLAAGIAWRFLLPHPRGRGASRTGS